MKATLAKYYRAVKGVFDGHDDGQAIAEYSVLVVLFVGTTLMLVTLLRVFSEYGWRILNLIGSDFP